MKKIILILIVIGIFSFLAEDSYAKDIPIEYRNNQPDISIKWNVDKRFPNTGPYLKETLSRSIYNDLNSQISKYKLPTNIGESVQIPLYLNVDNANYYYFSLRYDKSKLMYRPFWAGIRNNFQKIDFQKFKMDINQLSLKTQTNEDASDFELTLDKKYVYSERDLAWNPNKEQTTLTIRRVKKEQNTEKININFGSVYFYGEGYFTGPWGFWDGTYAYRLYEPGQWSTESYGTEYNQEEFRSNTPYYYYRTKPEGDINPFSITLEEDKTTAKLKNVDLYVGDDFDPNSVIESVQDADGNKIRAEDIDYYYIDEVKTKSLDTSKPGQHKVRVVVQNGQKQWVYSNTASVTVQNALTAEPAPQTTSLGIDTSKIDYSKFVKNVKLGDQVLSSDQYKIELINNLAIDTIGPKTAKIKVTLKSDTSKTVDVDVPYTVIWGNSVVFGSYARPAGRTSAAFTLYPENPPYIVASQGGTSDDNDPVHELFGTDQYYTFNLFSLKDKPSIQISESDSGNKFIKANGNDRKKDKLTEWGIRGINQRQPVNYGDVVRAWQVEPSKNWLYENEEPKLYNNNQQSVYYEITQSGYRPLHFNQLATKVGSVPIYSTNQYLNEHASEYVDLKGYSNISVKGFSQYPNTKISGAQKGKILVEEALASGKKVQYEYEVTINVESGSLTYTAPATLEFQGFTKSRSEQIIQRKDKGDIGLSIKDNRGADKQGGWKLTAQIKNKNDGIAPYLIYRDQNGNDNPLNNSSVIIYAQGKQNNATKPLEVNVSEKWTNSTGLLLKIPPKNNLTSQKYSTTITWNLVEGP